MCMYTHIYKMIGENAIEISLLFEICQVLERDRNLNLNSTFVFYKKTIFN